MKLFAAPVAFSFLLVAASVLSAANDVTINWLDKSAPAVASGASFGVPWPRGAVPKNQAFTLTSADGKSLPLQTWPLAYWPDGSLKWSGFATVAGPDSGTEFKLAAGSGTEAAGTKVSVRETDAAIEIDTGRVVARIVRQGINLIESISIEGREVARDGRLVGIVQNAPDGEPETSPAREKFQSKVEKVTIEQSGPVRAVVKIDGRHRTTSGREWLPFSVRLYFYAGQEAIRLVHTLTFDGDQEKDFIRGLGVAFAVPLREQSQNRHVRFSGQDGGLWAEPIQPGSGNPTQVAGQRIEANSSSGFGRSYYAPSDSDQYAIWSDYKLEQLSSEGFTISKRTGPDSAWVFADAGRRASGLAFVGDVTGGFAISVKNFWQSYPSTLEIRDAAKSTAQLTAWLWSPESPAMDMRHYARRAHGLAATYEDVQPGMSQAYGVARTSELTLYPSKDVPAKAATVAMAQAVEKTPLLVTSPQYLHSTGVFGVWSLPDRSTPLKTAVEDRLEGVLNFYQQQVDERHWYGFWHFGDFIHSYNYAGHVWYYDYGGHAWDNTELGTPLWVWYSFLRTGRADVFRMAEALTRNTSETNVYHIGPMAGLGSRHNVVKWGDGAKEARVSQAAHWRPFYYLTTDERTGDIMREQLMSDHAAMKHDPMRVAQPVLPQDPKYPGRVRIGPDWFAFAGNWMTEWERTGDTKWRDRILVGVDSILAMPFWIRSGVRNGLNPDLGTGRIGRLRSGSMTVGYDPETGKLLPIPDPIEHRQVAVNYNLSTIQGGGEVMFELVPLLGRDDFAKAWLQYCRLGDAPEDVLTKDRETGTEGANADMIENGQGGPRLAAYAYAKTKNPAFAKRAIASLANRGAGRRGGPNGGAGPRLISGPDSLNPVHEMFISTNEASQASLTAIEILELCADALPNELPAPEPFNGPQGGRRGGQRDGQAPSAPSEIPPPGNGPPSLPGG